MVVLVEVADGIVDKLRGVMEDIERAEGWISEDVKIEIVTLASLIIQAAAKSRYSSDIEECNED